MDWKQKLKAILHDPPYKIVNIVGHKEEAKKLFSLIISEDFEDKKVDLADQIASAQSRIIVKPQLSQSEVEKFEKSSMVNINESYFVDIFSEKPEERRDVKIPDPEKVKELFQELGELNFESQDERARLVFLFLWRFYPEIFEEINYHPADSRAPNHSIYDHLVQTSAVVSALPKPAFLLFTISPVQSFISKARKTSDLWAGSYMLSYLVWESMKPIVEEFGPDTIIYPNLLGQPLVDKWLYKEFRDRFDIFKERTWFKKFIDNSHLDEKLTIANLPNRFLAVVPYERDLAYKCEETFKSKLEDLAGKVSDKVSKKIGIDLSNDIKEDLNSYFKVYWAMMPWSADESYLPNDALEDYKTLLGEDELYETINIIIEHPYYNYKPANVGGIYPYYITANVGSAYPLLLELTEKLLGARKSIRDFNQLEEPGEKCHLCGEFEVLKLDWNKLKLSKGVLKEGEKLCGVCLTKRLFPEIISEEFSLGEIKFPSTSEMASIGEKRKISEEVKEEFELLIEKLGIQNSVSVPKLKGDKLYNIDGQSNHAGPVEADTDILYNIDGQFLMTETYRIDYFEKELGLKVDEKDIKDIVEFLKDKKISPSKYYAILQMDGDNMGKWLRGEFNIKIGEAIHENVRHALVECSKDDDKVKIEKILDSKHPISPSIHQAFSRRLSIFALEYVRKIVEEDNYGKLVYAGGDDILAFLPVEDVLNCAYELQKTFKEVLSKKATMSAGILIVHHKYPLYLALKKVSEAEKKAKNFYGKSAFCVTFMTHGGEEREFVYSWELKEFVEDLIENFYEEKIPRTFPYQYLKVVEELYDGNSNDDIKEVLKSELKRIFMRKDKKIDKELLNFEKKLLEWFEEMDIKNFANMLVVARKIAEDVKIKE
jgi:CRISPR-associated protein Cmr2